MSTEEPMSEQDPKQAANPDDTQDDNRDKDEIRGETWPCAGPAELDLSVEVGRLELALTEDATSVEVQVRPDPRGGTPWNQGISGLLGWLGEATGQGSMRIGGRNFTFGDGLDVGDLLGGQFGGQFGERDLGAEAAQECRVSWSESARRLVVRSADTLPLRLVPLVVTVHAPAGSNLMLRTGGGEVTVSGRAGHARVRTGSGGVRLDAVDGDAELTSGSGQVVAGRVRGSTRAKTGSGDLTLAGLGGPAQVRTGSGTVRLGGVHGDLQAKAGSGDLTVSDAEAGRMDLSTGSGDLNVGVHAGVIAELDLSSGSGRVRSELDVTDSSGSGSPSVVVRGRTGSGDVLVTRATATVG